MDLSQGNILSSNKAFNVYSKVFNKKNAGSNFRAKKNNNSEEAYYSKEGEPMYVKKMDKDEDGIVTMDEFRKYCDEKGIPPKKMAEMWELANYYRALEAQKEAKEEDKNIYAQKGDNKYDAKMDKNNDKKVSYEEYLKYCAEKLQTQEKKMSVKTEETTDGCIKITDTGKAINAYSLGESNMSGSFINDLG